VLPSELSPPEITIWHQTERILSYIGGRPIIVKDIRISETMSAPGSSSQETLGLWDPQNARIIIKRSVLSKLDSYAGILLHEALHAKYSLSDVSRDFEHHLTELCGTLAARILRSTNEA
jgi:hypothetical protein